jgi:hypothetical protein
MAIDVPHVSFLGFEAVFARLEARSLALKPSERMRFVGLDRSAAICGEWSAVVEAGAKFQTVELETEVGGRRGDRLLSSLSLQVELEAPFGLRSWTVESKVLDDHRQQRAQTLLVEGGKIKGGRLRWSGVVRPEVELSDRPVCVPELLVLLAEHDAGLEVPPTRSLDLLEGAQSVAADVRFASCGKAVWRGATVRGFRCFGPSVPPLHVWVGPEGAALLLLGTDRAWVRARLWGEAT